MNKETKEINDIQPLDMVTPISECILGAEEAKEIGCTGGASGAPEGSIAAINCVIDFVSGSTHTVSVEQDTTVTITNRYPTSGDVILVTTLEGDTIASLGGLEGESATFLLPANDTAVASRQSTPLG